jgi:hypothetical protein
MSYLSTPTLILGACLAFLFLPIFRAKPLALLLMGGGLVWLVYGVGTTGEVQPVFGGMGLFFLGWAKLRIAEGPGYVKDASMWGYLAAWVALWSAGGVLELWAMMNGDYGEVLGSLVVLGSILLALKIMFTGRGTTAGGE